jgi:hypothetical protein
MAPRFPKSVAFSNYNDKYSDRYAQSRAGSVSYNTGPNAWPILGPILDLAQAELMNDSGGLAAVYRAAAVAKLGLSVRRAFCL